MTECQVVQALGQPNGVDVTPQPGGRRRVVLTYTTGERAGIYEFVGGRLTGIERGDEPPPAVVKKPAAKKPAKTVAKKPVPAAAAARRSPAAAPLAGGVSLEDIKTIKKLLGRVGPAKLKGLFDVLSN